MQNEKDIAIRINSVRIFDVDIVFNQPYIYFKNQNSINNQNIKDYFPKHLEDPMSKVLDHEQRINDCDEVVCNINVEDEVIMNVETYQIMKEIYKT